MNERQALAWLAEYAAGYDPQEELRDAPGDEFYRIRRRLDELWQEGSDVRRTVVRACEGLERGQALARQIIRLIPSEATFPSLKRLARDLAPIAWLWPGWIPRGMLTLLGASPGAGKSLVGLDLARRIIHGMGFPDGAEVPRAGAAVIYVDAEAVPQIQNERANAWGMNTELLYLMLPGNAFEMIDLGDEKQQDHLMEMCSVLSPELVVVDSLSAISIRGENNVEDVRALLGFLSSVAREFACGLVLIHHLRKRSAVPILDVIGPDDFRGSSHIIAMARSVMALSVIQQGSEPNRNGPRRLEIVKTNLCMYPEPLGLVLEPGKGAPVMRYGEAPRAYREPNEAERCAEWLEDELSDAPEGLTPKELEEMVRGEWSRRTIYNARDLLGKKIVEVGPAGPGRRWKVAEG